jgi:hypothetical protein
MKYTKILYLFALGISLNSCDNAIYIDPKDEIIDSNAITNVADAQSAATGTYAFLSGANEIELSAYISDENIISPTNNGQGVQMNNWTFVDSEDDVESYWDGNYQLVARVNTTLLGINKLTAANATEQATLNRLRGEMIALRAYAHFNLFRMFTTSYTDGAALAVAYVKVPVVTEKLPRISVSDFYSSLAADLNEAAGLLNGNSTASNGYVTSDFVTALRARIALYKQDYSAAITYSNELINSGKYQIATSANFGDIWSDENGDTETIFKAKRLNGQGAIGNIFTASDLATVYLNPSEKLRNSINNNKIIVPADPIDPIGKPEKQSFDIRTAYLKTGSLSNQVEVNKYPGNSAGVVGLNDIKIFRISEIYLIRAEALANSGQLATASADYNALAKARQTDPTLYVDYTFASVNDAKVVLLEERFREFAFEGHRFFDLKRTGTDITRNATDCATTVNSACTLPASNFRFTMPIPTAERRINPGLQQNPGY